MVELLLNLAGRVGGEDLPQCAIYLVDAGKRIEKKVAVIDGDKVEIDASLEKLQNKTIAIGPDVENLNSIEVQNLAQFRIEEVWTRIKNKTPIEIPRPIWIRWLFIRVCLSGRVLKCRLFPPLAYCIPPFRLCPPPPPPIRCAPICNGVVEIYERVCCRPPFLIPDIPYIIKKLTELLHQRIEIPGKWPPPPPPEIGISINPPTLTIQPSEIKTVTMPEAARGFQNFFEDVPETLVHDIQSLESLSREEAVTYAQKRPYLWPYWCTCSSRKIGEVILQPDGQFHFCYNRIIPVTRRNCWTSYYYKVKQWNENQWSYIYDGSRGYLHFNASQYAILRTFIGRPCMEDPPIIPPVDKPWVMLQLIGDTPSYKLKSNWLRSSGGIDQTQISETSLANPLDADGGLVDGVDSRLPGDIVVDNPNLPSWLTNQPWGGDLPIRLYFHPTMKTTAKAEYYRIKVVPAGQNGAPLPGSTPRILADAVSWYKFVQTSSGMPPQIVAESLGPFEVKGEPALFRIPYTSDAAWLGYQSHQKWYTNGFQNGRYLMSLEIFDSNGKLLDSSKFLFLRWLRETGTDSTAIVKFNALVHLFWIDNTPCYADIVDLRKDKIPSSEECQYFEGISSTQFSAGFYAYQHPENVIPGTPDRSFLWYYTLWTHRGLNGPNLPVETARVNTPLKSSGTPKQSDSLTYDKMLDGLTTRKCAFALNLRARAKHTNGSGRLSGYDHGDEAAFSVEQK